MSDVPRDPRDPTVQPADRALPPAQLFPAELRGDAYHFEKARAERLAFLDDLFAKGDLVGFKLFVLHMHQNDPELFWFLHDDRACALASIWIYRKHGDQS